jgi:hypothetical protein
VYNISVFQLVTILFQYGSAANSTREVLGDSADLSAAHFRSDMIIFLPGVSSSILTLVVFGTTKTLRRYMWVTFVPRCIIRVRSKRKSWAPPFVANPENHPNVGYEATVTSGSHRGLEGRLDLRGYTPTSDGGAIGLRVLDVEGGNEARAVHDDEWPILNKGEAVTVTTTLEQSRR